MMMKIERDEYIAILKDCAVLTPELEKSLRGDTNGF